MLKKNWMTPEMTVKQIDLDKLGDLRNLSDAELKLKLEAAGFPFTATFQVKDNYVHRKVAGNDVLIAIGEDVANFNGYIQNEPQCGILLGSDERTTYSCSTGKDTGRCF